MAGSGSGGLCAGGGGVKPGQTSLFPAPALLQGQSLRSDRRRTRGADCRACPDDADNLTNGQDDLTHFEPARFLLLLLPFPYNEVFLTFDFLERLQPGQGIRVFRPRARERNASMFGLLVSLLRDVPFRLVLMSPGEMLTPNTRTALADVRPFPSWRY